MHARPPNTMVRMRKQYTAHPWPHTPRRGTPSIDAPSSHARARRTCVASTDAVARDDAVGGDDAVDRARGGEQSGARRGAAIDDDAIDVVGDIIGIVVDASGIVDDRARGDGARTRERDGWWWCGRWCGGESRGG